jgi:hypothetical protein
MGSDSRRARRGWLSERAAHRKACVLVLRAQREVRA